MFLPSVISDFPVNIYYGLFLIYLFLQGVYFSLISLLQGFHLRPLQDTFQRPSAKYIAASFLRAEALQKTIV